VNFNFSFKSGIELAYILYTSAYYTQPSHGVMQSSIFLYLSQARINWEGSSRKGIWCKNGGIDGGGLLIGPDGMAPT